MTKRLTRRKHETPSDYIGCNEILKCIIKNTQHGFTDLTAEERLEKIKDLLFISNKGEQGHPEADFITEKSDFYARIARDVLREVSARQEEILKNTKGESTEEVAKRVRNVRQKIIMNKIVEKHIDLISSPNTERKNLIKNWTAKYNKEGVLYENERFLAAHFSKMKKINKITAKSFLMDRKKYTLALNEILLCLRKNKWPI